MEPLTWKDILWIIGDIAWRLAAAVVVIGVLLYWMSISCKHQLEPQWRGIDRRAARCDSDGWVFDDRVICVAGGRVFLCIREVRDYDCAQIAPSPEER